jgi:hypothetical protein
VTVYVFGEVVLEAKGASVGRSQSAASDPLALLVDKDVSLASARFLSMGGGDDVAARHASGAVAV